MGIFEIISAIILIIACVFIIVVVLMKDTKTQMSQTISGTTADSYYGKNSGRTKDAMLNKATIAATVIFFVLAVAVNVINIYWGGSKEDTTSTDNSAVNIEDLDAVADELEITVEADAADDTAADSTPAEDTSADDSAAESTPTESAAE